MPKALLPSGHRVYRRRIDLQRKDEMRGYSPVPLVQLDFPGPAISFTSNFSGLP
jgi:hypothetical protein